MFYSQYLTKKCSEHRRFAERITCGASVLLGRILTSGGSRSLRSFTQPAMFDLKLESAVGGGAEKGEISWRNIHCLIPSPFSPFDCYSHPWFKNYILSPASRCCKNPNMAALIFTCPPKFGLCIATRYPPKENLDFRFSFGGLYISQPKLRLLCRVNPKKLESILTPSVSFKKKITRRS